MRDRRFIAEHRGGPLSKELHRQLIRWACQCSEHVLHLLREDMDQRLIDALSVARKWGEGEAATGEAMKASAAAHAVAREYSDPVSIAIARSIGHAVATAHMADHSMGAALYGLKGVKSSGNPVDEERKWQEEQLPLEVKDLVLSGMRAKERSFRI